MMKKYIWIIFVVIQPTFSFRNYQSLKSSFYTKKSIKRSSAAVYPAEELMSKLDEKIQFYKDGQCSVDDLVDIREELLATQKHYLKQLSFYEGNNDQVEKIAFDEELRRSASSKTIEERALHKYVLQMREINDAISDKLDELMFLLAKVRACRDDIEGV